MSNVRLPRSLKELWSCLDGETGAVLVAGGTDLLVKMRAGKAGMAAGAALVCLERIAELRGVREDAAGLWLGACSTHAELLDDPAVQDRLPVLAKALKRLGSPQIRNMGTIGGNICTASPAGDTLPPLYVLGAEVELWSSGGARTLPIAAFITGPGETGLRRGEILAGVRIKKPSRLNVHHFEKVGQRKSMAIAVASLAGLLRVSPSGFVEEARLAWGSVGPTVVAAPDVERFLEGKVLSQETLEEAAVLAIRAVSPIDDVRAGADYRRSVSGNLLLRLLTVM